MWFQTCMSLTKEDVLKNVWTLLTFIVWTQNQGDISQNICCVESYRFRTTRVWINDDFVWMIFYVDAVFIHFSKPHKKKVGSVLSLYWWAMEFIKHIFLKIHILLPQFSRLDSQELFLHEHHQWRWKYSLIRCNLNHLMTHRCFVWGCKFNSTVDAI